VSVVPFVNDPAGVQVDPLEYVLQSLVNEDLQGPLDLGCNYMLCLGETKCSHKELLLFESVNLLMSILSSNITEEEE
jgi:hypothetical protein